MNWLKLLAIGIIILIVQTTLVPYIRIFGIAPDMLLVWVTVSALILGRKHGMIVGAIAGFLQDIFSSTMYVHTISKIAAGYITVFIKENILGGEEAIATVIVFIISVVSAFIDVILLYFFMGSGVPSMFYFLTMVIIYSIYNVATVPVLFPVISRIELEKQP